MLDSRFLSPGRFNALPSHAYNTKVTIYHKRLKVLHEEHDGRLGEDEKEWVVVARRWPVSLVPEGERGGDTPVYPAGEAAQGRYVLTCPFRRLQDNGLIVRERAIVVEESTGRRFKVLWADDPGNSRTQIVAKLEFGNVTEDLENQS